MVALTTIDGVLRLCAEVEIEPSRMTPRKMRTLLNRIERAFSDVEKKRELAGPEEADSFQELPQELAHTS